MVEIILAMAVIAIIIGITIITVLPNLSGDGNELKSNTKDFSKILYLQNTPLAQTNTVDKSDFMESTQVLIGLEYGNTIDLQEQ